jgi:hypothetical protein
LAIFSLVLPGLAANTKITQIHITAKTTKSIAQRLYTCTFLLFLYSTLACWRGLMSPNPSVRHSCMPCFAEIWQK